jgi:hypothetical protein
VNAPAAPPAPAQAVPPEGAAGGPRLRLVCQALLALGAGLRLWQYGADASQWIDELALSRGILGLSWTALWSGPLPFDQVAPKGFTLLEKAGAALWGASDYGLRLLPLASSLAALWLFARLARSLLRSPAAVAFAVALFALQPELIRYSSQVKPYASDLAVALALTLLAVELASAGQGPPARTALLAGAAGVVAVFLSHGAALVLAGLSVALAAGVAAGGRRRPRARLGVTAALWVLAAGTAALVASREMLPRTAEFLRQFWAPALAPRLHTLAGDAHWLASALSGTLGAGGLGYPWVPLYASLAALGAAALARRRPALTLLLFAPAAVALGAAELRLYPFAARLVQFGVPALILAVAAGVETLTAIRLTRRGPPGTAGAPAGARGAAPSRAGAVLVYAVALLPAVAAFAVDPPVYRIEETSQLLRTVAARRLPGDAMYVYYGAGHAIRFYGPQYGFQSGDYVLGACHRGNPRAYLGEVDRFRGRSRLWVLFSHAQPRLGEEQALLAFLDRLGTRRLSLRVLPHGRMFGLPAEAFLYDLTGAERSRVAAASFPIAPAPSLGDASLACAGPANPFPDPTLAAVR